MDILTSCYYIGLILVIILLVCQVGLTVKEYTISKEINIMKKDKEDKEDKDEKIQILLTKKLTLDIEKLTLDVEKSTLEIEKLKNEKLERLKHKDNNTTNDTLDNSALLKAHTHILHNSVHE